MKQKIKISFYGILAVLAFALVLGACPDDPEKAPDRSTLKLSGQVYIQSTDFFTLLFNPDKINEKFNGNLSISDDGLGGTGEIKNGQLNYSIGVPLNLSPINEDGSLDYLKERYKSLKFSSEDVNANGVVLEVTGSEEYSGLLKYLLDINFDLSKLNITITIKTVNYVYVDKDLNITADADSFEYNDYGFPISLTTEKINLSLKKGWNALYSEITAQSNIPTELIPILMGGPLSDPDSLGLDLLRPTGNLKMSVSDPANINWTLLPAQSPEYPDYPEFE